MSNSIDVLDSFAKGPDAAVWIEPELGLYGVFFGAGDGATVLRDLAIRQFVTAARALGTDAVAPTIRDAIRKSFEQIERMVAEAVAADSALENATCAAAIVLFHTDRAFVAHIGDCRAHLVRNDETMHRTQDHSLLSDYIHVHKLTMEEISNFPHTDVLHRAIGMGKGDADIHEWPLGARDTVLLTTSELHIALSEDELTAKFRRPDANDDGALRKQAQRVGSAAMIAVQRRIDS